jgi:hypothetical protein
VPGRSIASHGDRDLGQQGFAETPLGLLADVDHDELCPFNTVVRVGHGLAHAALGHGSAAQFGQLGEGLASFLLDQLGLPLANSSCGNRRDCPVLSRV